MLKHDARIIYLSKSGFTIYGVDKTGDPSFVFPANTISDLEIVNEKDLSIQIKSFIETNKIEPSLLIIVLSSEILFEKDFPEQSKDQKEAEIRKYLELVPFENISYKKYQLAKGFKIVVVNTDLYRVVINEFEKQGFTVTAIVPYFLTGEQTADKKSLNPEQIKYLYKKIDIIKQQSLISYQEEPELDIAQKEKINEQTKSSHSLTFLLVIFVFLFIVLIVLVLNQIWSTKKTPLQLNSQNLLPIQISVLPTISTINSEEQLSTASSRLASSSANIKVEDLEVQILNGSGLPGQAEMVKKQLTRLGYKNIAIGNAGSIATEKALIIVSQTLPHEVRNQLMSILKKIFVEVSLQENNESKFDITIITARHTLPAAVESVTP